MGDAADNSRTGTRPAQCMALSPEQQAVVTTRGCPVQVIACAGAGKTEAVSRRIAALVAGGDPPQSIVAFTFTEKAAAELKVRVYRRVEEAMGTAFLGRLGPMFVGTIHAYCLHLLQDHVPQYGNYDLLDENRHAGLLSREYYSLDLGRLRGRHWKSIQQFMAEVDVVYNELISPASLAGTDLGKCLASYEAMLERFRYLTFGQVIARAVQALQDPAVHARVHTPLRHLVVDEYQDINPAQERLIALLSAAPVELCVVGDDDQSIYQWRGADVSNILSFAGRHPGTASIRLETNRRSVPDIVESAARFAESVPGRLVKKMVPVRTAAGPQVVPWCAATPEDEAAVIADAVTRLHSQGVPYRDMAVLYRSVRTSAPPLLDAFDRCGVPYDCGGRTGLFMQPEINLFGELYTWFVGGTWQDERFGEYREASLPHVVEGLAKLHDLTDARRNELHRYVEDWRSFILRGNRPVNLVGDYYRLLEFLGVRSTDPDTQAGSAALGAYARFSTVLADFENVTRRGRLVRRDDGRVEFEEGRDRGRTLLGQLAGYLLHFARDAYEDFAGEQAVMANAVSVLTVHQAKGLEWPVVFVPCLNARRFPSSRSGQPRQWLIPEALFPATARVRYEGGDPEERRLFYVAMTRARDVLYLSHFSRQTNRAEASAYIREVAGALGGITDNGSLPLPASVAPGRGSEPPPLRISFSDVASYGECGYRYRLSQGLGFENEIAIELGYGRAMHHILRRIAETARGRKAGPTWDELQVLLNEEFFLPFADQPAYGRMRHAAQWLMRTYVEDFREDLMRIWATERPFEVNLGDGIVSGRADVILDAEDGLVGGLAIVDYKSSNDPRRDERYAQQLAVYAAAARGEGLVVAAGYLHDLRRSERRAVDVSADTATAAVTTVAEAVRSIREGRFAACPAAERCGTCDYRRICRHSGPANGVVEDLAGDSA